MVGRVIPGKRVARIHRDSGRCSCRIVYGDYLGAIDSHYVCYACVGVDWSLFLLDAAYERSRAPRRARGRGNEDCPSRLPAQSRDDQG